MVHLRKNSQGHLTKHGASGHLAKGCQLIETCPNAGLGECDGFADIKLEASGYGAAHPAVADFVLGPNTGSGPPMGTYAAGVGTLVLNRPAPGASSCPGGSTVDGIYDMIRFGCDWDGVNNCDGTSTIWCENGEWHIVVIIT